MKPDKTYKHWTYKESTQAHGLLYRHNTRNAILIVYRGCIKLFSGGEFIHPCHSKYSVIRRKGEYTYVELR